MNEFKTKCHIQKIVLFPKIDDFLEKEDEKMQIVNKKRKILSQNEE